MTGKHVNTMKKRKITIARIWPKYKGTYESRAGVIMGLDPGRYRTIFVYLSKNSEKSNFFEEKGYKTFYLSNRQSLRAFNFLVAWKLANILKSEKVDIIHSHKHRSAVYGTVAAMMAGTPAIIAHVHGLNRTRNLGRKLTNFFLMKRVNKILTVGKAVRDDVLACNPSVPPEKVYSLGNSIDYTRLLRTTITKENAKNLLGLPGGSIVFGTIGRLRPSKGQSYLIDAFSEVKHELPSAQLVIAGDGCFKSELEKQAAKSNESDSVHFLGRRDDIPQILKALDVFVLPSIGSEGLPRALLEAMASGVPCVGTDISGIPEILDGGEFGFLVPPRDSKALAQAMLKAAKMSAQERAGLVERCKQRVIDHYSYEVVIKRLEKIYDELVEE